MSCDAITADIRPADLCTDTCDLFTGDLTAPETCVYVTDADLVEIQTSDVDRANAEVVVVATGEADADGWSIGVEALRALPAGITMAQLRMWLRRGSV